MDPAGGWHPYGMGGMGARRIGRLPEGAPMPVKFRMSGCWMSILLSIFLTFVLNLMLRGCSGW